MYIKGEMRINCQCLNCAAYWANWTKEVFEEMQEIAPGEECSQGMPVWVREECRGWVGSDEA